MAAIRLSGQMRLGSIVDLRTYRLSSDKEGQRQFNIGLGENPPADCNAHFSYSRTIIPPGALLLVLFSLLLPPGPAMRDQRLAG